MMKKKVLKKYPQAYCVKLDSANGFIVWATKARPRGQMNPAIGVGVTARKAWESVLTYEGVMQTGIELIAEERQRQIDVEGFNPEQDDAYKLQELPQAAQCYLNHAVARGWTYEADDVVEYQSEAMPDSWPWDETWWNPQNPIRDLVKAGALIAAEIDRLQRLKEKSK